MDAEKRRKYGQKWLQAEACERASVSGRMALFYRDCAIEYLQHENEILRRQLIETSVGRMRAEERRLRAQLEQELQQLRADIQGLQGGNLDVRDVVRVVCAVGGVPISAVMGIGRHKHAVRVRQVVWWLLRQLKPRMSLPTLGAIFKRDHTTVINGLRRVESDGDMLLLAAKAAMELGVHDSIKWPILEEAEQ